jgi:hypothetical protein
MAADWPRTDYNYMTTDHAAMDRKSSIGSSGHRNQHGSHSTEISSNSNGNTISVAGG